MLIFRATRVAGGLGEAVLSALALERDVVVRHLCVREVPRSGAPDQLLHQHGLSAPHVAGAARLLLQA
ncbi:jg26057 [Pararge aegeria aegeria]|uniref:Jg26057 protein n=1 Tax=Pararge aegeria aegeria TaxID=348720 RepID=A0A8S4QG22_9NEOP|nr:jg26057 [Pararge aegeria aegeria]